MKLFVIAALVAVASAGRLEHLERAYLPPFGSNVGFGSPSSSGTFGVNSAFPGATSNQYLPPNHGLSASNGAPEFAGSLQGFGPQTFPSLPQQQQYAIPSTQYGVPQVANSLSVPTYQSQYSQQSAAASRQYLAPSSFQNTPQQAFDEKTGYHY